MRFFEAFVVVIHYSHTSTVIYSCAITCLEKNMQPVEIFLRFRWKVTNCEVAEKNSSINSRRRILMTEIPQSGRTAFVRTHAPVRLRLKYGLLVLQEFVSNIVLR